MSLKVNMDKEELIITEPGQWAKTRLFYLLKYDKSDEYAEVTKILSELDREVVIWAKYKNMLTRRGGKKRRLDIVKLEKEYCAFFNGMLRRCGKLVMWEKLKGETK